MDIIKNLIYRLNENIERINDYFQLLAYSFPILIMTIKYIYSFRAKEILSVSLSKEDFKNLKYYITTYGQTTSPADEKYIHDHKKHFNLVDFFNRVFRKDKYGRYFIILADSGMGKSTFLQMLFLKYKRKLIKYKKIYFYPLSNRRDLSEIKQIKKKYKSIILLDALDEDLYAVENYQKRINEIVDLTQDFYKVVIACRTQFFPDEYSEPKKIPIIIYGNGNKKLEFCKIYISPFTNNDIRKFLLKKYKWNISKISKAKKIIAKSPDLMARPMLLTYIDDFLDKTNKFITITDIYEVLLNKWLDREAADFELLSNFTHNVVMYMYENNIRFLTLDNILQLCKKEEVENIDPILARTRSLLIRNGAGEYKFAHFSIYEYLISYEAIYKDDSIREKILKSDKSFNKIYFRELSNKLLKDGNKNLKFLDFSENVFLYIYLKYSDLNLHDVNFYGTSFKNSSLNEVSLSGANLNMVCLEGANLKGADLSECKLRNADLREANLEMANLCNADLRGANLQGAKLEKVKMAGARIDGNIKQYIEDNYNEIIANLAFGKTYVRNDIEKN